VFANHEIAALFNKIDTENSGKLDLEDFAGFMALRGISSAPSIKPVFK
jgi:Ca2+-binding EF-hand superfamily protein